MSLRFGVKPHGSVLSCPRTAPSSPPLTAASGCLVLIKEESRRLFLSGHPQSANHSPILRLLCCFRQSAIPHRGQIPGPIVRLSSSTIGLHGGFGSISKASDRPAGRWIQARDEACIGSNLVSAAAEAMLTVSIDVYTATRKEADSVAKPYQSNGWGGSQDFKMRSLSPASMNSCCK